jgi:hypothetical protein
MNLVYEGVFERLLKFVRNKREFWHKLNNSTFCCLSANASVMNNDAQP